MLWDMEYRFDRAFYRLVYPLFLRPTLRLGDEPFQVVDVSEAGVRFSAPVPGRFEPGVAIVGVIELLAGQTVAVEGTVVRRLGNQVAVSLVRGVPFAVMLDQQRLLQQRVLGFR
jgi:hypothetical protein